MASYTTLPPTPPTEPNDALHHTASTSKSKSDMTTSNSSSALQQSSEKQEKHIFIVTGPAGCGKTSVAQRLQARFGFVYLEGDDFHTESNISKMANGEPLTDADRWDWLIRLRDEALAVLHGERKTSSESATAVIPTATSTQNSSSSPSFSPTSAVLLTCSALKRKYRDVLRIASLNDKNVAVHFIFLSVPEETLMQRVHARQGHYMKESMVRSQLASLETPAVSTSGSESEGEENHRNHHQQNHQGEENDVVVVDAGRGPEEVAAEARRAVEEILGGN